MTTILIGDVRERLSDVAPASAQCIATSPPYFGLRKYGDAGEEMGSEASIEAYVAGLVEVMRLCREKLRDDGVAWVNLGDSYAHAGSGPQGESPAARPKNSQERQATGRIEKRDSGIPNGNALLVPLRVAAALQADGWILRAMVPWIKFAGMPESVQSRPCVAHEYVLFLAKRASGYFYDADAVRVGWADERCGAPGGKKPRERNVGGRDDGYTRPASDWTAPEGRNGRSLRSSDFWRAGAKEAADYLSRAAAGEATGLLTGDDAPVSFAVNPKGSGIPHFAMWPVRLVMPMILASTPEAGCCSACGAPWVRVVERSGGVDRTRPLLPKHQAAADLRVLHAGQESSGLTRAGWRNDPSPIVRTLGFKPSCAHVDALAKPSLVLDPFAGAGTTLAVAECLGRDAVGVELYQKHADLYPERLAIVAAEMAEIRAEAAEINAAAESEKKGQLDMWSQV